MSRSRRCRNLSLVAACSRKRRAQRALAVPGELEQVVVREAEQRALQRHREREIVLRQQQRVREVHQVDDRDVLGQFQPVGAGDGNAGLLQRLDDRIEDVAAAAHQHQHVAITQPPAVAGMAGHGAAFDQPLDLGLDAPRKLHLRAGQRHAVERRAPALDVLLVVGFGQGPQLDRARDRRRRANYGWDSRCRANGCCDRSLPRGTRGRPIAGSPGPSGTNR